MTRAEKIENAIAKIIGFAGCVFMTVFAGLFGFISVSALVMSVIERDLFSVVGCVAAAAAGWFCWSLRKDTLV